MRPAGGILHTIEDALVRIVDRVEAMEGAKAGADGYREMRMLRNATAWRSSTTGWPRPTRKVRGCWGIGVRAQSVGANSACG